MRPVALVSKSLPCCYRGVAAAAAVAVERDLDPAMMMGVIMEKPEV